MITISFGGWAQCRLATDPDPFDEPRGVSGYMRAYAGEPDLDRIIRFQDPPFQRSHGPRIGVRVTAVATDAGALDDHPLIGASVELVGGSKFEGRNGAIAEDTFEPIYPFHLRIRSGDDYFGRATVPSDPESPYREFGAPGATGDHAQEIVDSTGISSLVEAWKLRLETLRGELGGISAAERPALEERIAFLQEGIRRGDSGSARYFFASMEWNYLLKSKADFTAGAPSLVGEDLAEATPWLANFWFGGWDPDVQAFYASGRLEIGGTGELPQQQFREMAERPPRRPERMSDIGSLD